MNELDQKILQLEEHHPGHSPQKEDLARTLGLSPARYYQRLWRLLEDPEIFAMYPIMGRRVLDGRDRRKEKRERREP